MKRTIVLLFFISSCSKIQTKPEQVRDIASMGNCSDLISIYFNINQNSVSNKISASHLLQTGKIDKEDYQILKSSMIIDFLSQKENREEVAANLTLIKSRFKHFDDERVVKHYQFLESSCGI